MTILFAPSEGKKSGGTLPPIDKDAFCFSNLYSYREEVIKKYNNFLHNASNEELKKLFGVKDEKLIEHYKTN